ncbi:glycosyltransferase family 4 protein [Chelativorans sp. M5D2P16]|uniref:glycosyltransferase family 4 protein n=1 Tax=Chelativorans sp. M5D2P16 TaxID=3095678 RepID=UPI002ACA70EF|nr:glycosyltransferase family 4 protein [Chelativorans sp. M5D2P16]MDZ5697964.1 glycosyltransferase family 4 protein [Chelativorans sp. M5D2P16]
MPRQDFSAAAPGHDLRVTLVLPSLAAGGSERIATFMASHWAERGWRVTVVTLEAEDTEAYYPTHPRVEVLRLGLPTAPGNWFQATRLVIQRVLRLRRAFLQLSPNLIISFLTRTNILAVIAASGTGIPVIISERNNPERQRVGPFWVWLRRLCYPRAFGLVAMTRGALELFPCVPRERRWVVPNPVVLPSGVTACRSGGILVAVGRLVPQKGFDLLLEAFARIAAKHDNWHLTIWGEGPERPRLTAQRDALGLKGRVALPGVSSTPGQWLAAADAFVLSSRYEGWGNVLAEAMAAGLPSVSFDCPFGPEDMITDSVNGLLVPDGDVDALSTALSRLLSDEVLRKRLGEAARLSARRFSGERIMALWDDIVDCAVREHVQTPLAPTEGRNRPGPVPVEIPGSFPASSRSPETGFGKNDT